MNFKRGVSLLCFCLLLALAGHAQVSLMSDDLSSVNVDDISDNDIRTYYQKAVGSGLSEKSIYTMLAEKGLSEDQIAKLKDRVDKVEHLTPDKSKDSIIKDLKLEGDTNKNVSPFPLMKKVNSDLAVFGSELFTETSMTFQPDLRISTPTGYVLGPDDAIIINVFGYSEKTYNVTINPEGLVYLPQVGPIFLNGLSIEQAAIRIKAKLASTIYKAINSGQTNVQVSLGKIRSIRVTVIGESKKPGTYTVSSLTTLFNLLYLCGGPSDYGSYRNIELIRGNTVKQKADLYNFLLKGDQKDNILLREGDVIRIPFYSDRVVIDGYVKRKGKYEIKEGETFQDLLNFCGGFTDNAYKADVSVYQITEKDRRIIDLPKKDFANCQPQPSDSIVVAKLSSRFENMLTIRGAIMRPGEYELSDGLTLKDLIEKAGGLKEDVYTKRGIINRLNFDRTPVELSFSIDSILNNQVSIPLKKDDSVTIFSIFDLRNEKTITIDGQVKKPGKYKWAENITLRDMLLTAGGLTEFGDPNNIEIARIIKNEDVTKANYLQTEIVNINISDSSNKDLVLMPSDVIIVKQQSGYSLQRSVYVSGMVINPGRYVLKRSGDRIADVIKRVGGFTANADSSTIIIRRFSDRTKSTEEREKILTKLLNIRQDSLLSNERLKNELYKNYDLISINLAKAMQDPTSSENMVLDDGDIITIDRNTNLVKVSGEVYFATIIPFQKGANVKYYIQKSGNYTQLARKSSVMVIYADGRASKTKHFLFFKKYPEVTSRSEVFVPQKSTGNRQKISIGEWSLILSTLGIITNVLVNIKAL